MLHAFFCVNLPLLCKVDKASIIFFWNWMLYIGSLFTKFSKTGRRNQAIHFLRECCMLRTRQPAYFLCRYILNFFGKSYYYRLCHGFIVLSFVFCQLIHDTQRNKLARISGIVVWYGCDSKNFRIYILFNNFPVIKNQGCSLRHC